MKENKEDLRVIEKDAGTSVGPRRDVLDTRRIRFPGSFARSSSPARSSGSEVELGDLFEFKPRTLVRNLPSPRAALGLLGLIKTSELSRCFLPYDESPFFLSRYMLFKLQTRDRCAIMT